jgi:hypothetical protein
MCAILFGLMALFLGAFVIEVYNRQLRSRPRNDWILQANTLFLNGPSLRREAL